MLGKACSTFAVCVAVAGGAYAQERGASIVGGTGMIEPSAHSPSPTLAFPSIFGAASAVAAPSGSAYVALTYVNPRGGVDGAGGDGDLSFGFAFGNPVSGVSGQVAVNVLSLTDDFADSGNLSVSFSRMLRAGGVSATFVSLAGGSLLGWGDAEDNDSTYTAALSHIQAFTLFNGVELPVQFTIGYGSDTTLSDDGLGTPEPGLFAGIGAGVAENVSTSISATRTQLNMGMNFSLPQLPGAGVSLGVYDITNNTRRQQVSLGLSFAF